MKIAIFGKTFSEENIGYFQHVIDKLESLNCTLIFYKPFYEKLAGKIKINSDFDFFNEQIGLKGRADFMFSIGGDGTLLDTITFIQDSGIPIMGINLGRMGFLSSISKDQFDSAIEQLWGNKYKLDKRSLLKLITPNNVFGSFNYALNELAVYKKEPFSMLKIEVHVDEEFLNSYWADGLLIATPTGSTAYSLSNGGPIVLPNAQNFVITPIATHNLTVRPLVIPDSCKINVKVVGRIKEFFVSLDSRTEPINSSIELTVIKEDFKINIVQLENESYFQTIRKKLMWGLDIRN